MPIRDLRDEATHSEAHRIDCGASRIAERLRKPASALRAIEGGVEGPVSASDEIWIDDSLVVFDGQVLEVFGFRGERNVRFHVRNLSIDVGGPDRKGRRMVQLKARTKGSGGLGFEISEEDWAEAGPLLERVREAAS